MGAGRIARGLKGLDPDQRTNHVSLQPGATPHSFRSVATPFSIFAQHELKGTFLTPLTFHITHSLKTMDELIGPYASPWCLCVGARTLMPSRFSAMAWEYSSIYVNQTTVTSTLPTWSRLFRLTVQMTS